MYFVFCRFYPFSPHPPRQCLVMVPLPVIHLLLTNTISRGAGLPIHMMGEVSMDPNGRRAGASLVFNPLWAGPTCCILTVRRKTARETRKVLCYFGGGGGDPRPNKTTATKCELFQHFYSNISTIQSYGPSHILNIIENNFFRLGKLLSTSSLGVQVRYI